MEHLDECWQMGFHVQISSTSWYLLSWSTWAFGWWYQLCHAAWVTDLLCQYKGVLALLALQTPGNQGMLYGPWTLLGHCQEVFIYWMGFCSLGFQSLILPLVQLGNPLSRRWKLPLPSSFHIVFRAPVWKEVEEELEMPDNWLLDFSYSTLPDNSGSHWSITLLNVGGSLVCSV